MTKIGWENEMASEDKPDDAAADDGMADWAEALLEQKATDSAGADGQSGGLEPTAESNG